MPASVRVLQQPPTSENPVLSATINIRAATPHDAEAIRALHVAVASISGGLARYADEITAEYINGFITHSLDSGVIVVAVNSESGEIVGEVHAYRNGMRRFVHMLTSLTVAVHPNVQGMGVGRKLFEALLTEVRDHHPGIIRVELIVQETNTRARRLYESVGFVQEGRLVNGIIDIQSGLPVNDVPMAWLRNRSDAVG